MTRTYVLSAGLALLLTNSAFAASRPHHALVETTQRNAPQTTQTPVEPPKSDFGVPSTAGTSALGAPLVGGGRLSGQI
jgi:hypothetical protein